MSILKEKSMPLADEEIYRTIPAESLQHLRFSVRYSPVKKRLRLGSNYVFWKSNCDTAMFPLPTGIKHDVPIKEGFQPVPRLYRKSRY